jgi:hypothetical protein
MAEIHHSISPVLTLTMGYTHLHFWLAFIGGAPD